jgi:hypothetical protein
MHADLLPNVRNKRTTVFSHTVESFTLSRKDNTPFKPVCTSISQWKTDRCIRNKSCPRLMKVETARGGLSTSSYRDT